VVDGTESLLTQWQGHPDAMIVIIVVHVVYPLGVGPVRARYGLAARVDPKQMATFSLGVAVMLLAVASPIHAASERYLFSAHMAFTSC
jgi:cytochrome c oxidase assembly factor CtaG